ncbi:MAG: paraquat-inducible protein A [Endozoicomonas sp.]
MSVPELSVRQEACCPRCHHVLTRQGHPQSHRLLALVMTGLFFFLPANLLPVLTMELAGQQQGSTLWSGVLALWQEGLPVVAVIVFATSIGVPLLRLLILLPVLLCAVFNRRVRGVRKLFRCYVHLGEWGMVEIYMLGVLVSVIKLADMASVQLGAGVFCFGALMVTEIAISLNLDRHWMWENLVADSTMDNESGKNYERC